jgi:hypothetical protein
VLPEGDGGIEAVLEGVLGKRDLVELVCLGY